MSPTSRFPVKLAALFLAINLLNYLDRYLVPSLLPLISAEFQLSNEQSGYLVSAFIVGYVIFSPIFGYLGDRMHRPTLMVIGVAAWSIATLLSSWASGFVFFVILRMGVGLGEASFGTIAPGFIKDRVEDPIRLTRALSIFFSAIPVGAALGYVVGSLFGTAEQWRYAFVAGGIPGLILCLFLARAKEVRTETATTELSMLAGITEVSKDRILRLTICGYVLQTFALTGIAAFITTYGVSIGFELQEINRIFGGILVVTGFVGTLLGGRAAVWLSRRSGTPTPTMLRFIAVVSLLGAPFVGTAFLVEQHGMFLLCCFVAELFVFATTGPVNSIIVSNCPPSLVTLTQGLTILAINLFGAALAPVLIGIVADRSSLALGLQLCSAALLLSAVAWWRTSTLAVETSPAST